MTPAETWRQAYAAHLQDHPGQHRQAAEAADLAYALARLNTEETP